MSNTVVIIPSRLKAKRLPNKPLKLINKKEMILHVCDLAKKSDVGKVLVATPDKDIFQLIKKIIMMLFCRYKITRQEQIEFLRLIKIFSLKNQT